MATKASIRQAKYDANHCRIYRMKLNLAIDKDIIDKLASVPSMQGYIKQLIREDLARTGTETEKTTMRTYKIKPEFLDMWEGGETPSNPDRIITEDELRTFSAEWETPVSKLLEQLIEQ